MTHMTLAEYTSYTAVYNSVFSQVKDSDWMEKHGYVNPSSILVDGECANCSTNSSNEVLDAYEESLRSMSKSELMYEARYRAKSSKENIIQFLLREKKRG